MSLPGTRETITDSQVRSGAAASIDSFSVPRSFWLYLDTGG
jgi:hypothetical protein